jgi:hypothetical protein
MLLTLVQDGERVGVIAVSRRPGLDDWCKSRERFVFTRVPRACKTTKKPYGGVLPTAGNYGCVVCCASGRAVKAAAKTKMGYIIIASAQSISKPRASAMPNE